MDDSSRRRRQNESPYTPGDPRFTTDPSQSRAFPNSSSERYRPAPITTSSSTSRGAVAATAYSGYYPDSASPFPAVPSNTMQYQPTYAPDQRQQQSFSSYNPDLMYSVSQQPSQNTVYDSPQQFQSRQPAAMQLLSDVAVPYFSNEPTSASGPPTLQHHASSGSSAVYTHQSPAERPLLQQGYSQNINMGGMPQNAPDILEEAEYHAPQGPGMEAAYETYQAALKEVFQNIINGQLAEASQSLLQISEWLLGHVGDLGTFNFHLAIL